MKKRYLLLLLIAIFLPLSAEDYQILSGVITKDESPFSINCNYMIPEGDTLIISAGVSILFQGQYELLINGKFIANGTKQDSIYIGSIGNIGWNGLNFVGKTKKDTSFISYCQIFGANTYDPKVKIEKSAISLHNYAYLKLNNSYFVGNKANYGAVISLFTSKASIKNSVFSGNYSGYLGGVLVASAKSFLRITNCIFEKNLSDYYAGAIYIDTGSFITISGSLFDKNSALSGGTITIKNSSLNLINNTITGNSANFGGGLYLNGQSNVLVINSIIWGNTAGEDDNIRIEGEKNNLQLISSIVEEDDLNKINNGTSYTSTFAKSPKFKLMGKYPFSLSENSPAINAGTMKGIKNNLETFDLAGNPRILGKSVDIGAYEKNQNIIDKKGKKYKLFFLKYNLTKEKFEGKINFIWKSTKPALVIIANEKAEKITEIIVNKPIKGKNKVVWNGKSLNNDLMNPGIYFYKVVKAKK